MRATSQHAVNMVSRNESLSAGRQLLIDEFNVSRRLFVVLLGVILIVSGALLGSNSIAQLLEMPIEQVDVRGDLQFVEQQTIQGVIATHVVDGYLNQSLSDIKTQIEKQPWVFSARLQRAWPNKLYVDLVEQKPIAVWSDKGLINERGELFLPKNLADIDTSAMPEIVGPSDRMEQTWQRYLVLKEVFSEYNLGIRKLVLDEKGGQKLVLNNGIHVILGSQDLEQRLSRFFKVYKSYLADRRHLVGHVDLRYTNGIAVSWLSNLNT